jgi:hypothetical protein
MTLSGTSIVSVSAAEDIVSENYAEYRRQLVEGIIDKKEDTTEEYEQINIETDEDTPTLH